MRRHHGSLILTALAAAFLFAGCWGASKSTSLQITGGSSVADTATAVGIDKCFTCHSGRRDVSNPADNGITIFNMWADSKHGNSDPASHASYANFDADPTCGGARCHDPNGDGLKMLQLGPLGSIPTAANRPVVGCEACHGGGSEHFGVGPMAFPFPNATACGQCHSATSPPASHMGFHPNGFGGKGNPGIYAAYAASGHARSINDHVYADAAKSAVAARCSKCHTDEGARKFSLVDNVMTGSPIDCAALNPPLVGANNVQCRTCHKSHNAGVALLNPATTGKSGQYNTCVACHQDRPQIHSPSDPLYPHPNSLVSRHAVGDNTAGFIVNPAGTTACTECHNPHSADLTENLQWAASGHGDNTSPAFDPAENFSSAGACGVRCHSTTGFVVYTDNQSASATAGDFTSHGTTGGKQETIYCRACHKLASTGFTVGRRTAQPARIPAGWDNGTVTTASYKVVAGYGDSELCMNCHSSRRAGSQVPASLVGKDFSNYKFALTSHHAPAAATLFQDNSFNATDNVFTGTGMYQFPGKNYSKTFAPGFEFQHDKIGTTAAEVPSADNSTGPCVGCHMSSPNVAGNNSTGKHSFMPVIHDDTDTIVGVSSTKCTECHAGQYALTATALAALEAEFAARLAEFDTALNAAGIYFSDTVSPNFFNNAGMNPATDNLVNWAAVTASITTTDGVPLTNVDLLGVAYNRYFLSQDSGAWAHNDRYTYRIIYDSIQKLGGTPSFARP